MYTQLVCLNLYLTVSVAPDSLHPHKNETRWFTGDGPSRLLHANLLWYPWGADFHERGEKLVIGREAVKRRLIGVDPWTLQQKKRALGLLWIKFHKPAVRAGPEWTLSPTIPLFYQYNCVLHLGPLMLERMSYNDERWRSWRLFKGDKVMDKSTKQHTQHHRSEALVLSAQRARGKTWLISRDRTKPCCIMLGDADGSVFLPDVSVGVTFSYSFSLMPPPTHLPHIPP